MHDYTRELFDEAFTTFLAEEAKNILSGVNERALCGRLAIYIEKIKNKYEYTSYYVDTEYNRKQEGQVKTILNEKPEVIQINCDLIVHTRGNSISHDNLIAIEMKKSHRPQIEKDSDRNRLRAMTKSSYDDVWSNDGITHPEHVCGYVLGIYIEVNIKTRHYIIEEYRSGSRVRSDSGHFKEAGAANETLSLPFD